MPDDTWPDPYRPAPTVKQIERYWSKVQQSDGCWTWTGRSQDGYGTFDYSVGNVKYTPHAHRVAWFIAKGHIPDGLVLDHLCRNRLCVNPDHLDAVAIGENTRRGLRSFQLTGRCRRGLHDVTDPTNVWTARDGERECRPCRNVTRRAYLDRQRALTQQEPQ